MRRARTRNLPNDHLGARRPGVGRVNVGRRGFLRYAAARGQPCSTESGCARGGTAKRSRCRLGFIMPQVHRILVAEDEPEVRNYLGIALQCQGYEVEFAETGEEVLNHLAANRDEISLILMDIMMPRKDGIDTLRE